MDLGFHAVSGPRAELETEHASEEVNPVSESILHGAAPL